MPDHGGCAARIVCSVLMPVSSPSVGAAYCMHADICHVTVYVLNISCVFLIV